MKFATKFSFISLFALFFHLNALAGWQSRLIFEPTTPGEKYTRAFSGPTKDVWVIQTELKFPQKIQQCFYYLSLTESRQLVCQYRFDDGKSSYEETKVMFSNSAIGFVFEKTEYRESASPDGRPQIRYTESTEVKSFNFSGAKIFELYTESDSILPTAAGFVRTNWIGSHANQKLDRVQFCQIDGKCFDLPTKYARLPFNNSRDYFILADGADCAKEVYQATGQLLYPNLPRVMDQGQCLVPKIFQSPKSNYLVADYLNARTGLQDLLVINRNSGRSFWLRPDLKWTRGAEWIYFVTDDLLILDRHLQNPDGSWSDESSVVDLSAEVPMRQPVSAKIKNARIDADPVNETLAVIGLCSSSKVCRQFFDFNLQPKTALKILIDLPLKDQSYGVSFVKGSDYFLFGYEGPKGSILEIGLVDGTELPFLYRDQGTFIRYMEKDFLVTAGLFGNECSIHEGKDLILTHKFFAERFLFYSSTQVVAALGNQVYLLNKN